MHFVGFWNSFERVTAANIIICMNIWIIMDDLHMYSMHKGAYSFSSSVDMNVDQMESPEDPLYK